jgi:hypothetical protein
MKNIYLVEGIWHVGKTTLIKKVNELFPVTFIEEPSHLTAGRIFRSQKEIDMWYMKQHFFTLERVRKDITASKRHIFIERTPLSSLGFGRAYGVADETRCSGYYSKLTRCLNEIKKSLGHLPRIIYVTPGSKNLKRIRAYLSEHPYLKKFDHGKALSKYDEYLAGYMADLARLKLADVMINPSVEEVIEDMKQYE